MPYDYNEYKSVIVLYSNLEIGVALNVVAHISLAIGSVMKKQYMGKEFLIDKSGIQHRGISKYPVIITKVKQGTLRRTIEEARQNESILLVDYPQEMLSTKHDDELNMAINLVDENDIVYLGAILFGKRVDIDKITGKFTLWK